MEIGNRVQVAGLDFRVLDLGLGVFVGWMALGGWPWGLYRLPIGFIRI